MSLLSTNQDSEKGVRSFVLISQQVVVVNKLSESKADRPRGGLQGGVQVLREEGPQKGGHQEDQEVKMPNFLLLG